LFMHEEMTIETKVEIDNRRTIGRCVEDFDAQVVSPISGYLLTEVTA
jgi:hypothetical protein